MKVLLVWAVDLLTLCLVCNSFLALCYKNNIILLVSRYGTGTLTKVFVDRVFQECLTYEGEVVCALIKITTVVSLGL